MMRLLSILYLLFGFYLMVPSFGQGVDTSAILRIIAQAEETDSTLLAKEKYEVAYSLSRESNFDKGVLITLPKLADIEIQENNIADGLRYLLEELELLNQYNAVNEIIAVNILIGDLYSQEQLFNQANGYYQSAVQLANSYGKTNLDVLYDKLGFGYTQALKPDSAAIYYLKLLEPPQKEEQSRLRTLRKLVTAYQKAERYETALSYNFQIKTIMEANPQWQEELGVIYNNLGYTNNFLSKFDQSVEWFLKAEDYFKEDQEQLATLYTNLGVCHFNKGEPKLAIQYLIKALALLKDTDYNNRGNINNLLSTIYLQSEDFYNAQNYNKAALKDANKNTDLALKSKVYETAANIHSELYEYEAAIDAFKKHLQFKDSLTRAQQARLDKQSSLEKAEKEIKLLLIRGQIQDLTIEQLELEKASDQLAIDNLTLQTQQKEKDIELLKQAEVIREAELKNQALETERTRQLLLLAQGELERETQQRQLSELAQAEEMAQAELKVKEAQLIQQEQQNAMLESEKKINELTLDSQKKRIANSRNIGLLLLLISLMVLAGLIYSRRINKTLAQQKLAIEVEQQKSESLLLNILPASVAQELKEKGRAIPRRYESVSILFSDFVGFTRISAQSTPEIILRELNDCFMGFDQIMEEEGIEKIQTVGDGYLAVGGLPDEYPDHAVKCIRAAQKMHAFLAQRNQEQKMQWHARIGIHSGPITAGVIGTKKFAYSIFGDTVNTASRIETAGEQGRINISATTYELVKTHFECEYRGKISAKGKGELDMYFVK